MKRSTQYCPNYSATLVANDAHGNYVYRARCKVWTCDYCAQINRNIWQARIINHLAENIEEAWHFVTLTLLGEDHNGLVSSVAIWRKIWDALMKRVRRMAKKAAVKLQYIRVFEPHQDGTLHVHMLINYAPADNKEIKRYNRMKKRYDTVWNSDTLSEHLLELGLGYIYDWQPISAEIKETSDSAEEQAVRISGYITKYLTKTIQSVIVQANKQHKLRLRAVQTSQSWWNFEKTTNEMEFERGVLMIDDYLSAVAQSRENYDLNLRDHIEIEDFYEEQHYPNKFSDLADIADNLE